MSRFEIGKNFLLDGEEFKIISGAIHYFRIVPEYWRDRLEKLKAMGCNTVETYVPWNMHEPRRGDFDFSGILDIGGFLSLAREVGLYAIVRPSPYICAEWEFGGLPAWLLCEEGMRLRSSEGPFLERVGEYYEKLLPLLTPYQIDRGGPVIMMQVENEYGYYGDDGVYMERMKRLMINGGVSVPMVTSDGPNDESLRCGSVGGILPTGNFGSRTEERFDVLRRHTDGGPLMCTEFWVGWFDHWGNGGHMTGKLEENVRDLEDMLARGHVNIYMFIGGTNFGFMNGSNYYDELTPDVTSYDYDALLTEAGDYTPKYHRFREVIGKYAALPEAPLPEETKKKSYGILELKERVGLFESLDLLAEPVRRKNPASMEELEQYYGYILYRSPLAREENLERLRLWGANDRAQLFLDNKPLASLYDRELLGELKFTEEQKSLFSKEAELAILIENMGRVNFGPAMETQKKGVSRGVQINGHYHYDWDHYLLPLDNPDCLDFSRGWEEGRPAFYRFLFQGGERGDTFLDFAGFGKGCAFINGFNLGRFWEIGPQKRLYIPGPLIRQGENEIILFETEGKWSRTLLLADEPDIG
jgi:beta-galactosidase